MSRVACSRATPRTVVRRAAVRIVPPVALSLSVASAEDQRRSVMSRRPKTSECRFTPGFRETMPAFEMCSKRYPK